MKNLLMVAIVVGLSVGCSSGGEGAVPVPSTESATTTPEPESSTSAPDPEPTVVPTTTEAPLAEDSESAEGAPDAEPTATAEDGSGELVEVELATAVRSYFDAREAASAGPAPNPDDPRLSEVAASPELERLVQSVQDKADADEAIRPGEQGLAEIRVGFVEGLATLRVWRLAPSMTG